MKRYSKSDLIEGIAARRPRLSAAAIRAVVDDALAIIGETAAAGDVLALNGLGTFEMRVRKARTGRNLQTGVPMDIPASKSLSFKAAKAQKGRAL